MTDVLANVELIKRCLEQVKDAVQASIQSERAREGAKAKGGFEDEHHDVTMYDGMKPQYTMTEVKKRRGVSWIACGIVRVGKLTCFVEACCAARSMP